VQSDYRYCFLYPMFFEEIVWWIGSKVWRNYFCAR